MFSLTIPHRDSHRSMARLAAMGVHLFFPLAAVAAGQPAVGTTASVPARAVKATDALFGGPYSGARAIHTKGRLCRGTFVPAESATDVSTAPHFSAASTPVLVRFSNFSGVPNAPDGDPFASPRGMAIKFTLPGGDDTDIVANSYDGFPVATPEDFVSLITALASRDEATLGAFLATHAAARTFMEAPKLPPASYGTESYYGVNAFLFTNGSGEVRAGRYRIVPLAGVSHLTREAAAEEPANYLSQDLAARLASGTIRFRLDLQLADANDKTVDGSVRWPADRRVVPLGTLTIVGLVPGGDVLQRDLLFTPLNLVEGILPSDDPMLAARSRAYRISQMRRSAEANGSDGAPVTMATP